MAKKQAPSGEMKKCVAGGKTPKECMKMMAEGRMPMAMMGGKGKGKGKGKG